MCSWVLYLELKLSGRNVNSSPSLNSSVNFIPNRVFTNFHPEIMMNLFCCTSTSGRFYLMAWSLYLILRIKIFVIFLLMFKFIVVCDIWNLDDVFVDILFNCLRIRIWWWRYWWIIRCFICNYLFTPQQFLKFIIAVIVVQ